MMYIKKTVGEDLSTFIILAFDKGQLAVFLLLVFVFIYGKHVLDLPALYTTESFNSTQSKLKCLSKCWSVFYCFFFF